MNLKQKLKNARIIFSLFFCINKNSENFDYFACLRFNQVKQTFGILVNSISKKKVRFCKFIMKNLEIKVLQKCISLMKNKSYYL